MDRFSTTHINKDLLPIKFGFTCGFTGPYTQIVENQIKGAVLAVEEINALGGIAGHSISFLAKDDQMDTVMAKMMMSEFLEEKTDIIAGSISASSQLETNRLARAHGIPFISVSQSNTITTAEHLGPYTFHEGLSPHMTAQLLGRWGVEHLGKRWVLIVADYQWGYEIESSLVSVVHKHGGNVLSIIRVPLGSGPEVFAQYIDAILALKPDVLSVTNLGWDQASFIQAANSRGLKKEMSILHTISEVTIVDMVPLESLVGMYWGVNFYWGLEAHIPSARNFVQKFRERYNGELPTGYAGYAYSGTKEILNAFQQLGVYPLNNDKATQFLEGRSYDNYKGGQWWRPCDHQSFQDIYVLRFKGPEESLHHYDIGEIVSTVSWDLDIERTCENLGFVGKGEGHIVHET